MENYTKAILDLEKKHIDGAGDDVLNNAAIEILEGLTEALQKAKARGWKVEAQELIRQGDHFDEVLKKIKSGRHKHVLDEYNQREKELGM